MGEQLDMVCSFSDADSAVVLLRSFEGSKLTGKYRQLISKDELLGARDTDFHIIF